MFKKFGEWLASIFKGKTSNTGSSGSSGGTDYSGFFNVFDTGTDYSGFFKDFIEGIGRFFNNGSYNNEESFLDNVLGTNLGDLLKALTNRVTAGHLTGAEHEANAFNAEQAQLNRDFEERMASSQFQRQVADMQAAGVNPALAMQGSGNAAPSGVAASSAQPSGPAFSFSDLMQMMLVKPQIELIRSQGRAALQNSEANLISANAAKQNADTQAEELRTVKQPLAVNHISVGNSVVSLNKAQEAKIYKELDLVVEDTNLAKLQQIATSLNIQYQKETWSDNKRLLSAQVGKVLAEEALASATKDKTLEEFKLLVKENGWKDIFYGYWSDPANSDRGVIIEMLKGTNIGTVGVSYLQALGDNIDSWWESFTYHVPPGGGSRYGSNRFE